MENALSRLLESMGDYRGIAVIGVEVVVAIVAFIFLYSIVRIVVGRVTAMARRGEKSEKPKTLMRGLNWLFVLLALLTCVAIVGLNGFYLYKGEDIYAHTVAFIQSIPPDFWRRLIENVGKVLGLMIGAWIVIRIIRKILAKIRLRALNYERIRSNDESINKLFAALDKIQTNALWLAVAGISARMLELPTAIDQSIFIVLRIYLIIAIGILVVNAVAAIVDSMDALSVRYAKPGNWLASYERLRVLIPMLRRTLEYIIYVIAASLILLQLSFISEFAKYGPSLVEAIGIIFLARVAVEISDLLVDKGMVKGEEVSELERQREQTIVPIVKSLFKYVLYFIAFVLVLRAVDINPWPLLAGAGIVGVVIGLGAQPLINDILAGFFILFENLFLVGDFIEAGPARGVVERIEMRTTRIRNPDGQLHILRNGEIREVVNYSKGFTNAAVEVGVAYDSDLDHVYRVLEDTGRVLKESNPNVLEPTVVDGLIRFGESDLAVRTVTRVKPGTHGAVARAYRKLIKDAFDKEGIEIPFARRVLIIKKEGDLADELK